MVANAAQVRKVLYAKPQAFANSLVLGVMENNLQDREQRILARSENLWVKTARQGWGSEHTGCFMIHVSWSSLKSV